MKEYILGEDNEELEVKPIRKKKRIIFLKI